MKSSQQIRREAKSLFRVCQVNGVLDENRVRQAVRQLLALKPRGFMSILASLERWVKLDIERRTARIESAVPLPAELRADLQRNLARHYGPGLRFTFSPNAALLGGVRIQVGSDVYDGSVEGRLARLQEALSQ
jgi:F-type H+-transporting ATPase subunit delta